MALSLLARNVLRRRTSDALVWVAVLVATLLAWDVSANPFGCDLPVWFWQTALVLSGLALAATTAGARGHGLRYADGLGSRTRSRPGPFEWTGGLIPRVGCSSALPCGVRPLSETRCHNPAVDGRRRARQAAVASVIGVALLAVVPACSSPSTPAAVSTSTAVPPPRPRHRSLSPSSRGGGRRLSVRCPGCRRGRRSLRRHPRRLPLAALPLECRDLCGQLRTTDGGYRWWSVPENAPGHDLLRH